MPAEKPLTLYFLNGATVAVDRKAVLGLMTDPFAVFIMLFAGNIIRGINALVLDLPLGLMEVILLSVGLAAILWETFLTIGLFLVWAGERAGRTIIAPVPLIGFMAILLNDMAILWTYSQIFEIDVWNFATLSKIFLINYCIHLGFEFFFAVIVVPRLKRRDRENLVYETRLPAPARNQTGFREGPAPLPARENARILVAGEAIATHEINLVEADEHYVFVYFSDIKLHVRESFGSLVSMLENSPGMQVHKSYWIAFRYIRDIDPKRDGSLTLILEDLTTIPVARGRAKDFRLRYREWKARHSTAQYS